MGRGTWPDPLRLDPLELRNPAHHSQWIEIVASLRSLESVDGYKMIRFSTATGDFVGKVRASSESEWREGIAMGSLVRVRGVFGSLFNRDRELIGLRLFVPSPDAIQVEDPGGKALWQRPIRSVQTLLQFDPPFPSGHGCVGLLRGI